MIRISDIRRDGATQSRAAIHEATVADYADINTPILTVRTDT